MAVTTRRLTLEEFLKLPEQKPPLEYFDGVVTQKDSEDSEEMSPKGRHGILQAALIKQLDQSGMPSRVARSIPELRVTFGDDSAIPDVSVYRWDRIPVDAAGEIGNEFVEAPDITIEIVSPGQSASALVRRCLWYVTHGVRIALLVDPADRSVLAFRPNEPITAWRGSDDIDLHEILPDFDLTVDQLFGSLRHD